MGDYCKIYVDFEGDRHDLEERIRAVTGGAYEGRSTIRTALLVIDVEDNEDFDPAIGRATPDAFLYFRYYCDVDPAPSAGKQVHVEAISALLRGLRAQGHACVPACDFEDELPRA